MNNNHNAFQNMLDEVFNMQVPVIKIINLREVYSTFYGEVITNHIIIPAKNSMCIDMVFEVYGHNHAGLINMVPLDMSFKDAITHYTDKVLADFGSSLEIISA